MSARQGSHARLLVIARDLAGPTWPAGLATAGLLIVGVAILYGLAWVLGLGWMGPVPLAIAVICAIGGIVAGPFRMRRAFRSHAAAAGLNAAEADALLKDARRLNKKKNNAFD